MFKSKFDAKKLGERLKKSREAKGMTQEEVWKLLGYQSRGTMSSHETGDRSPRPRELVAMAELYGVSIDWLLTGEESDVVVSKMKKAASSSQDRKSQKANDMYDKFLSAGFTEEEIENFINATTAPMKKPPL